MVTNFLGPPDEGSMARMKFIGLALVAAGLLASGCASMVEGTEQRIHVHLSPAEAVCRVERKGKTLQSITREQPVLYVSKSRNDLIFTCDAAGHYRQILVVESSASGWGIASCFLFDWCITDYSTGALNKYSETLSIVLLPEERRLTGIKLR